jgi:hypothetical protein
MKYSKRITAGAVVENISLNLAACHYRKNKRRKTKRA